MEFISQGHLQGACLEKGFHLLLILGLKRHREEVYLQEP